jgi:hypothetical protein
MAYAFKRAAGAAKKLKAEEVGPILERLAKRDGGLRPAAVVDEARPADNPMHSYFEWDDSAAGERYREQQAAYLIRAVVVVEESEPEEVRAFVHIEDPDEQQERVEDSAVVRVGSYQPIDVAMADPSMRDQVLRRALIDLRAWERKYQQLDELRDVFAAADRTMKQLGFEQEAAA